MTVPKVGDIWEINSLNGKYILLLLKNKYDRPYPHVFDVLSLQTGAKIENISWDSSFTNWTKLA